MKCELLAESNHALLLDFIDDENTKYDETVLKAFLDEKNAYGYIAVDDEKAIGFAYGACRCYEKAGGINAAADIVMYEYKK